MASEDFAVTLSSATKQPQDILNEGDEQLLTAYALSTETRPCMLSLVAAHENSQVKHAVAGNSNMSPDTLDYLANSYDYMPIVTRNPSTSARTFIQCLIQKPSLSKLASETKDIENAYRNAFTNKNLPLEAIIQTLLEHALERAALTIKSNERINEFIAPTKRIALDAETNTNKPLSKNNVNLHWKQI